MEQPQGSPVDFYLSGVHQAMLSNTELHDYTTQESSVLKRRIRTRREMVNSVPLVFNALVDSVANSGEILNDQYELYSVLEARRVTDNFIKIRREFPITAYEDNSKERYDYLKDLLMKVQKAENTDRFWIEYRKLEFLVFSIVHMELLELDAPLVNIARTIVLTMLEQERKLLIEYGDPTAVVGSSSSVFTDDAYESAVNLIIDWKKNYIEEFINLTTLNKVMIDIEEVTGSAGVLFHITNQNNIFPTLHFGRKDIATAAIYLVNGIKNRAEKYGLVPDYRPLIIYSTTVLERTVSICRGIHVLLNNNSIFEILYKEFAVALEITFREMGKPDNLLGEVLDDRIRRLYAEDVITKKTYDEEFKKLVDKGWLNGIEVNYKE